MINKETFRIIFISAIITATVTVIIQLIFKNIIK